MVKSMFGLVIENNTLYTPTRCCRLKANEGQVSDSLLFHYLAATFPCRFLRKKSSTQPQPCSLTDPLKFYENDANIFHSYFGNFIVWVIGLLLLMILVLP